MIHFEKHILDNGLRVIVHPDPSTPMVAVNVCYDVGSRDENPEKTGFAHLFEHLMFGGSINISSYDEPLQKVGGDNNAFTTNDITNYYLTLPKENIETGFWLESDRMLELAFSEESLEVQRAVVIEEFKQRYLNQPYGDISLLLKELAYKVHPYRWPTIGKEIGHIERATLDDVKEFFFKHYAPNNATLVIAGDVKPETGFRMAEKWFGGIPRREVPVKNLPVEPIQTQRRFLEVERKVPSNALYMAFHMDSRLGQDYHTTDLISDVLSNGQSSRLYKKLVNEKRLFNELDAYISGDSDAGLFMVSGKMHQGIDHKTAENAVMNEINKIIDHPVPEREFDKVKNKVESHLVYGEINYLNKAMNLASYEILDDASLINNQVDMYRSVTKEDLSRVASQIFKPENCSVIYYHAKQE